MTYTNTLPFLSPIVFAPADETGGGEAATTDAAAPADAAPAADATPDTGVTDTGIGEAVSPAAQDADTTPDGVAIDGGTAEGQDNSGEDKDSGEDGGEEPVVPEEYVYDGVELPEGVDLDPTMTEAMNPVFKELGLTQEQANALVSTYAGQVSQQALDQAKAIEQMVHGWVDTAKSDKEIGHNNWQGSVDAANAVIRKFGTPELVQDVMVNQGMGNHPEVIRLLARIGKSVGDDKFITGVETDTSPDQPAEARWYGDTTPTSKKG